MDTRSLVGTVPGIKCSPGESAMTAGKRLVAECYPEAGGPFWTGTWNSDPQEGQRVVGLVSVRQGDPKCPVFGPIDTPDPANWGTPTADTRRIQQVFYLDPDQIRRLKARSKETGAPISELIRRAIDAYPPLAQTTEEEE